MRFKCLKRLDHNRPIQQQFAQPLESFSTFMRLKIFMIIKKVTFLLDLDCTRILSNKAFPFHESHTSI